MELSRVIIFTGDVKTLVDFYISHFDLALVGEFDAGWTELNAGGCNLAFHKFSEKLDGGDNGIKFVFAASDVAAEKARLEGLGVKMTRIFTFGQIQMCDGQDPDGNRFQISSRGV
jgi:predicted enzyme related to lactoylglutathione lyase